MAQDMWLSGFFAGISVTLSIASIVILVVVLFVNRSRHQ